MTISHSRDLWTYWLSYVDLWKEGRTNEARDELKVVLAIFDRCSRVDQIRFSRELCEEAFERRSPFPHDADLLRRVMIPYLRTGLNRRRMPQILWLAEAMDQSMPCLDPELRSVTYSGLLEMALDLSPKNDRAWRLLAGFHVWILDFGSHEMPSGWVEDLPVIERALDRLGSLCRVRPDLTTPSLGEYLSNQRLLLSQWREWAGAAQTQTFEAWCAERGFRSTRGSRPDLPDV